MAIITTFIEQCTGNLSRHSETKKDINVVKEETDGENEAQRHVFKATEPVRGDQGLKIGHSGS